AEYARLWTLGGLTLRKRRINFEVAGRRIAVERFEPPLQGLILAEVEFEDDATMETYPMPSFARTEVTADGRYAGFALALRAAEAEPNIRDLIDGPS
ncbi:MAG: hypothetical protein WD671_07120, partial [Parvibaculum sp.]